jgi:MFS family permease
MSAVTAVFVHLVPLIVWKGQSEAAGAFIVAYVSLTSIPLKVFLGWTGDRWAIQNILGITGVLGAISLVILLLGGGQMWQLILFATLFAAPMSGGSITWAIVGDFFGRKSFATLRGGALGISSLMSMGVPVFAGWVYDTTGSYNAALVPAIATYLVGALLIWKLPKPKLPSRAADPTTADALTGE